MRSAPSVSVGEGMVGAGQHVEQQQREIGAHGLVEHDVLRFRRVDRRQRFRQCGVRTVGIGPGVELDVGLLARAFGVEPRHQEGFLVEPDQQQAGPLIRMRMEAEQPVHMRARPDRDEVGAVLAHLRCEAPPVSVWYRLSCFVSFCFIVMQVERASAC